MHFLFKLMTYLKTKWFGVFLYDEEKIKDKKLFPKEPDEIAEKIYLMQKGGVLEEEEYFKKHKPVVDDERLSSIGKIGKVKKLYVMGKEFGYDNDLLRKACIKLAMRKIREEQEKRERRITEAVETLDDIIKVTNILLERMRSWYDYFSFEGGDIEDVLAIKVGDKKLDKIEEENIKNLAKLIVSLQKARKDIENYIKKTMEEMAPNVSNIAGAMISARLIARAGGIDKLAVFPAGTIQLLGAERALFRHLKDGTPPPKHGIIFQHEMIKKAPKEKRGKIARLLATKISIAAKADAFTKNFIANELKKEMMEKYEEIIKSKEK